MGEIGSAPPADDRQASEPGVPGSRLELVLKALEPLPEGFSTHLDLEHQAINIAYKMPLTGCTGPALLVVVAGIIALVLESLRGRTLSGVPTSEGLLSVLGLLVLTGWYGWSTVWGCFARASISLGECTARVERVFWRWRRVLCFNRSDVVTIKETGRGRLV